MIDPHNVVRLLTNYVAEFLPPTMHSSNDARDEAVATQLYEHLVLIVQSSEYRFENEQTLDFIRDRRSRYCLDESDSEDRVEVETDSDYDENDDAKNLSDTFSFEYMKKAISYYDEQDTDTGKKKHSWKSFHHSFKSIPDRKCLSRIRKYVASHGTKRMKLNEIVNFTYTQFEKAREQFLSVHDIDLKRFALKKAKEVNDNTFVASDTWLNSFKRRYGICSRKITKLVTKGEIKDEELIARNAKDFVMKVQRMMPNYKRENIINTDQSGLSLEIYSNRTLSNRGEHLTVAKVRSIHNTTHSYTIQPIISMSGHQIGPLFLCLKEKNGHMSDNIKRNLFKADNVVTTCSQSGKLTTSLVEYWVENVLLPTIGDKKTLLLSDYWGGQRDPKLYQSLKNFIRMEIPKKTTCLIQPCDVYYNRQYKYLIRQTYDYVRLYDLEINLSQRNNIIKMNSLVYNQLSSPRFNLMLKYAWYQSGYLKQNPGVFENVKEVCFSFKESYCQMQQCDDSLPFIKCSHCNIVLCFEHFFIRYHFH